MAMGQFRWRPTRQFMRHVEDHALELRSGAALEALEVFAPRDIQEALKIRVMYPDEVAGVSRVDRESLGAMGARVWSAISRPLPSGILLIVLNPNQSYERENVTILEEVAHEHYGHVLMPLVGSGGKREYSEFAEREAYMTAAAMLLPSEIVARSVWRRRSSRSLAKERGTSAELVEMRIKILGLWPSYTGTSK